MRQAGSGMKLFALAIGLAVVATTVPASAQSWSVWDGVGNWNDSGRWSAGVPVGAGSGALIRSGTATIDGTVAASTNSVLLGWSGNAAINMTGGSLNVTGTGGDQVLAIGEQGTGDFTQSGGVVTTNYLAFGRNESVAVGSYHLNGGTLNAGSILVGYGTGTLNLNGGTLKPTASATDWISANVKLNVGSAGGVIDSTGLDVTVNANITGTGPLTLRNNSGDYHPIVLAGSNASNAGVVIESGFVQLGAENALGSGVLTLAGDLYRASLNMNGHNQTLRGLVALNAATYRGDVYNFGGTTTSTLTIATQAGDSFTYNNQIGVVNDWKNVNVTKQGDGTQILGGINYYAGVTTVSGGTLLVNGAIANGPDGGTPVGGDVTVTGATLGGSGLIDRNVFVESVGHLAPTGTLSLGQSLTFGAGSVLDFDLGSISDLVHFTTAADHLVGSGNATLALTLGSGFDYDTAYTLFDNVTLPGFTFADITGYDDANYTAHVDQVGTNYNLSFAPVPEPGTMVLFAMGLAGLLAYAWRKQK